MGVISDMFVSAGRAGTGRLSGVFVSWDQKFFEPIPLPRGKPLITLRDAAALHHKLPKAEHDAKEWQAAMEALLLVAERNGPTMFPQIGIMRKIIIGHGAEAGAGSVTRTGLNVPLPW